MAAGTIGSGGTTLTLGTNGQIPFMNAGGTDFSYSSGFTWTAASYTLQGQSSNATLQMNDSVGTILRYTANQTLTMDGADMTLVATQRIKVSASRFEMYKGGDVASATTLTLSGGNSFDITGTTTINHITTSNWQAGSEILLQFDASVTVTHNAGSPPGGTVPLLLSAAGNMSATVNDTLSLWYDAVAFREKCRTVI